MLTSPSIPPFPVLVVRAERDPTKRIVITGMGIASVFGNEISTFYDSCVFFFFFAFPARAPASVSIAFLGARPTVRRGEPHRTFCPCCPPRASSEA